MQERKQNTLAQYPLGTKGYISKTDGDYRTEQSLLVKLSLASVKLQLKYLKRKYLKREEVSQCTKDINIANNLKITLCMHAMALYFLILSSLKMLYY